MKSQKLVRRVLFTAAISTASIAPLINSDAFGFESATKPAASKIQLVQYQPGQSAQNSASPNATVTQELNRMFQESGQPMPSMNPKDLPNAQGQGMNNVRPTQRAAQQPAMQNPGVQQAATKQPARTQQPAKQNFLQRFMGKVSGTNKKASEATVVPPVPPDYREPNPAPPSGGQNVARTPNPQQGMQNQNNRAMPQARPAAMQGSPTGQQNVVNNQNRSMPNVATRPASSSQVVQQNNGAQNAPTQSAAPIRTAQAATNSGQIRTASQPTQPVPDVPAIPGAGRSPRTAVPQQGMARSPQYVQPGTSPAFMPSSQSQVQVKTQTTSNTTSVATKPPVATRKPEDGFEDPFTDSGNTIAEDVLDLDSLVAASPAAGIPVAEANTSSQLETKSASNMPASAEPNPFAEEHASSLQEVAQNPLTGIRLDDSDDEIFDPSLTDFPSTQAGLSRTPVDRESNDSFESTLPPVDDFGTSLPAINLPAVEDLERTADTATRFAPDLHFPELDAEDAAEAKKNSALAQSPDTQNTPSTNTLDASATPLRSADTERLQQAAEGDRRLRQQRLIQSRAGQMGFKGFCPVELRDRRELVDANSEFTATFGLQTYSFSSAQARTAFESDPSRYAPAAGGNDVVLLVNSGEEEPGMMDYALWYRDRLYLFRSRETMAMFNKDPLRFANQY